MIDSDMSPTATDGKLSRWYFSVLGAAAVFYFISCAPGLLWQDSGVVQYRVWHNDFEGGMEVTGFAIPCVEWLTVDPLAGIIGPYGSANINPCIFPDPGRSSVVL